MQKYHKNAKTNTHTRSEIQYSNLSRNELALKYRIHVNTVFKWSTRDFVEDKSSIPKTINYALSEIEKEIIKTVRKSTWWSAEQIVESLESQIKRINKSNVSRCLRESRLNKRPEEHKEKAKLFKEYKPGFLHVDVCYLPKIDGIRWYLFVAIDRATRIIYYEIYENKTALNGVNFLRNCQKFYGFKIEKVLTDNGFEFTNKYCAGVKDVTVHKFDELCEELEIEHRLIKPYTPKTNGMVERVNRTIKESTIQITKYNSLEEMKEDLLKFMKHYNLERRHTSLKREIKVKTPMDAYKFWYDKEPNLFHKTPNEFYQSLLHITW